MNLLTTILLSPPLAYFTYRIIKEEIERIGHKKKTHPQPSIEGMPKGIIKVVPTIKSFNLEVSQAGAN